MSYSPILFDAGNVFGYVIFGCGGGIVLYVLTVLVEYFVMIQNYHFLENNKFGYVAAVNAVSAVFGLILYRIFDRWIMIDLNFFYLMVISFVITLVLEPIAWLIFLKPPKKKYKPIIMYSILANCASYLLPFVFFGCPAAMGYL
jgi:hypothetical protein